MSSNTLMYVAGLDRGVRPIGDWSMAISLSRCSSPSIRLCAPGSPNPPFKSRRRASTRMSLTSELLPDPETPVTHTSVPSGMSTSMPFRLLCRAPTIRSRLSPTGRCCWGTSMRNFRDRYCPVRLRGSAAILRRSRWPRLGRRGRRGRARNRRCGRPPASCLRRARRRPPCCPCRAARERVEQAVVVARVQPDRRLVENVEHADQAAADLAGQPDALRLAAGERGGGAVEREILEPHVGQKSQPAADLLEHFGGDHGPRGVELQLAEKLDRVGHAQVAHVRQRAGRIAGELRCRVARVTARACGLSRWPPQVAQPCTLMYFSSCRNCILLFVLR